MKASICFDEADLLQKMLLINPNGRISSEKALEHAFITEKSVNMFGSMRNRANKPLYAKQSGKKERGVSIDNHENMRIFQSLNK
jgi:serine/threonine protein kinase